MGKRNYSYDFIRVIACFLVIINHTVTLFLVKQPSQIENFFAMLLFLTAKLAIPFFLMLTGALLLNQDIKFDKKHCWRILRIVILLLTISFILYYRWYHNVNLISFFKMVISKELLLPYWYLYMLIGTYLMLPFIKKMVDNFTDKDYKLFLIMGLIGFGILPVISIFTKVNLNDKLMMPILTYNIFWPVIGYWLSKANLSTMKKRYCVLGFLSCLLFGALILYMSYINTGKYSFSLLDNSYYFTVSIPAICSFILIQKLNLDLLGTTLKKILISVSACTLGIYVLHPIILSYAEKLFYVMNTRMPNFISVIVIQLVIFWGCYFVVLILKKIPFLNKIL